MARAYNYMLAFIQKSVVLFWTPSGHVEQFKRGTLIQFVVIIFSYTEIFILDYPRFMILI